MLSNRRRRRRSSRRAGGNFLDTSDSYQFGESLLGEIVKTMHDDLVLATKFT